MAIPVLFRDGVGTISKAIPSSVGGLDVPRTLSKEWNTRQGLKGEAGSAVVLRSLRETNVIFVSLGCERSTPAELSIGRRQCGAGRGRVTARLSLADGRDRESRGRGPGAHRRAPCCRRTVSKIAAPSINFDVVPVGVPLPTVRCTMR